jgi:hypothetical protein
MANHTGSKLLMLAIFMLISLRTYAQVAGATLSGTLSDTSGAVIPSAQLSIKNVSTGEVRSVTTDSAGFYSAPNLLPGKYEITATAPGFSSAVRSGITFTVGAQQVLNIAMAVGQVSQKVEVTGEAPAIELASSTISGVVTQNAVVDLPLNGRDWTSLATLQPGVTSDASIQPTITAGFERGERGFGVQMTVNGARPEQNGYRLDGINVNDYAGGGPGSVSGATLGVDAIREFSVLTTNYSSEYGRTSGGVVNAISRSGSNQLHGDAYEFLRNSALDARTSFDGPKIPEFRRNQFGGSLGGPIQKDRTFFFGDYEGFRQTLGVTQLDTVPSQAARNGTLCSIPQPGPGGCSTHLVTGALNPDPATGIDKAVLPYLGLWPLPNANNLLGNGDTGNATIAGTQVITENFGAARVDHRFTEKDSIFASWLYDKGVLTLPDPLNDVLNGSTTGRDFASIEETHIFNPQFVNSFRVGFNRNVALVNQGVRAINPLAGDPALGAIPGLAAPGISISGVTLFPAGVTSLTNGSFHYNAFQGFDDVFLTKGIHSLKFGFTFERDYENYTQSYVTGGLFGFGSLNQFLANQPNFFLSLIPPNHSIKGLAQSILGGYVQDDIRVRPQLTFNLGVRYEMSTVPTEKHGKLSTLRAQLDPTTHIGGPIFQNPTLRDFAPRVGFAWDPFHDGKTSVRGGFGQFDSLPLSYEYQLMLAAGPPFMIIGSATQTPPGSFPTGAFANLSAGGQLRTPFIEFNPKRNYILQWNLNVQREVLPNLTASIAYVGAHGVHNPFHEDDSNTALPTLTSAGYLWPFPAASGTVLNPKIGRMDSLWWSGSSLYNGLQVEVAKKMTHNFQGQVSYTWSKSIDDSSASPISDPFANSITSLLFFDKQLRRSLSDFNVGQNIVVNFIWMVPTPSSLHGPAAWAARGWQFGGIFEASTGLPFTPLIGGDPLGLNSADPFAYPNRLGGPGCQSPINPGNTSNYIKLECFGLPMSTPAIASQCTPFQPGGAGNPIAAGTCSNLLGNSIRNDVIGPGLMNFDFSLFKNNQINERLNLQFRSEFFNVFNHSNYLAPIANQVLFDQTGASVGGAGTLNANSTTAREIQFALKLIF